MTNSVCIYLFDKVDTLGEHFVAENIDRLPAFREARCMRYRREADKQACIIAYMMLQKGLYDKYGILGPVAFIYNCHEKPYLKDYPHIFFNLSHCEQGIVCAVADFEIGIDITDIHPYDPAIADMVCGAGELRLLAGAADPARARLFCRMWAAKESYAKARGISVANVLKFEAPESAVTLWEWEKYIVALCSKNHRADDLHVEWLNCTSPPSFENSIFNICV